MKYQIIKRNYRFSIYVYQSTSKAFSLYRSSRLAVQIIQHFGGNILDIDDNYPERSLFDFFIYRSHLQPGMHNLVDSVIFDTDGAFVLSLIVGFDQFRPLLHPLLFDGLGSDKHIQL